MTVIASFALGMLAVLMMISGSAVDARAAEVITACVDQAGHVRIVSSTETCRQNETPLQWNVTGQQEVTSQPLNMTVNCGGGETVANALARGATTTNRLTITVVGVCQESVTVSRDGITLQGAAVGDGLSAPTPTSTILSVMGQRINLNQLTLTGGAQGISAFRGAAFVASNIHVTGFSGSGIALTQGAAASLSNSTIENGGVNATGVSIFTNASLTMVGGFIQNNFIGINAGGGGSAQLNNGATIRGHSFIGGLATSGGSIQLNNSITENNGGQGLHAFTGGTVWLSGSSAVSRNNSGTGIIAQGGAAIVTAGARVANNNAGVHADNSGSVMLQSGAIVENNTGFGVYATGGGSVAMQDQVIVRGNTGDGVRLRDTTVLQFMSPGGSQIVNNGGAGVACDPAPAVAMVAGSMNLVTVTVSGNSAAQIACPVTF